MYVATKGGERAIAKAHQQLAERRRGDLGVSELSVAQIREQLALAVDRVMGEGSLYDRDLAALAIKQARGDMIEAIFLLRAYRTTLPRFGASRPIATAAMRIERRISATFKDAPGGQILGPTFDYTHRLLDFALAAEGAAPLSTEPSEDHETVERMLGRAPHILALLDLEGVIEAPNGGEVGDAGSGAAAVEAEPRDLTRQPLTFPADRPLRLQALARGDEGFMLGLAYSSQRGYGRTHPFVGELRIGVVTLEFEIPELGLTAAIGEIQVTELETVNQFTGSKTEPAKFTRGYGLTFGQTERRALGMALLDRSLRWRELGEDDADAPAQDEEFVISHVDNIQASGFLEHIKLPHYVDFQSELELIRTLRREAFARRGAAHEEAAE